jgi:hypothetical protein
MDIAFSYLDRVRRRRRIM